MKKISLLMITVMLFAVSCKKTVESEQKAWEVNLRMANQLCYEYPNFDAVIKEQIKSAEMIMNEAKGISDEKSKIKRMADANSMLRSQFIRNLDEIKSLKQGIRTKSSDLRGMKLPYNEMMSANSAISEGQRAIYDSEMKIKRPVNSRSDAEALTNLVVSDLELAESGIEKMISTVKEREAEEKKVAQKAEEVKKTEEQKKIEQAQPVKCQYCGVLNPPDAKTCKGCGAALTKK
ncbi:MAG TPA: hypothetical protein PK358_10140 [Spirochaetota bacterium]|nr:hypothetical protein [Spirochaetota bacterium]HPJ35184.1 hypothetical protein [Spirochaetota bacterium]